MDFSNPLRKCLTRFSLSAHWLEIETGVHEDLPGELRLASIAQG